VSFEANDSISRRVESWLRLALIPPFGSLRAKTEVSDVDLSTGRLESSTHKGQALRRCPFIQLVYASLQAVRL
jgi:hypothetical protein